MAATGSCSTAGEGTQRQLLRSDVGLVELEEIFLTHYHADHYLGLPGMLKTFALRGREIPLTIYGPQGPRRSARDACGASSGGSTYPSRAVELEAGEALERDGYAIEPFAVDHGVTAVGYATRRGRTAGAVRRRRAPIGSVFPTAASAALLQRGESVTLVGRVASSRPTTCSGRRATGASSC